MKLLVLQTLLSLGFLPAVWRAVRGFGGWVRVPPEQPPAPAPRVSVVVPARNEERAIERCVRSLLQQRYPRERFEVLAMDDRSSDRTPAILAGLAAEDPRLKVLHGTPLPAGWLGKCWALHQAVQAADPASAYLLFVDADTVHAPDMLAAAVAFAERERVDLLSLGPAQEMETAAERLILPTILALVMTSNGTLAQVNDPAQPQYAKAVGQFLLFRRTAYEAIGGHTAVKREIVEDFALARLVKGRGLRLVMADGRGYVTTRMYHSAQEIWDGFGKNAFDEAQKQPGGAAFGLLALPVLAVAPHLLALVGLRRWWARGRLADRLLLAQGLAQSAAAFLVSGLGATTLGLPWRYALAQPVATAFLWGILASSTWRTLSGRGVTWKGRTY